MQESLGKIGEDKACEYLREKGYKILETNWRWGRKEIDIIAKCRDELVFIEVKTRTSTSFGRPEEWVTPRKERSLSIAAAAYLEMQAHPGEFRFDVISLLFVQQRWSVDHIENAFFSGI